MGAVLIDFIFKRKQLNVECFVNSHRIATTYPIRKSIHYIPEWWKKLDPTYYAPHNLTNKPYEHPTVRSCYGIVELYKAGLIMPLWSDTDIFLEKTEEMASYSYQAVAESVRITQHRPEEYGNNFKNFHHMKLISPWILRERSGVKFLFVPCTWSHLAEAPELKVVPGIVNYKHQHTTNVNWFVPHTNAYFRLEAGLPLVQMIPLTDKKIKITTHVLDSLEYEKLRTTMHHHKFKVGFQKVVKENRCPMGGSSND